MKKNAWLALGSALGLVACGGGGDGGSPPPAPAPVLTLQADEYTVPWNAAAALTVMSNDQVSGGTGVLSVTGAPQHGTAVVSGSTLSYTPASGYFGADTLTYQVAVGSTTATATVKLSVEARMELSGVVTDGPIPNATVTAKFGAQTYTGQADATGHYTLPVKSADPAAFLSLTGTGAGNQAQVVLTSLVGDAAALAKLAAAGKLDAQSVPALRVDHLSTARQGLLEQRGVQPKSSAELLAANDKLQAGDVVQAAALIKLVVDQGVALPTGVKTTSELVSKAATLEAFATEQQSKNATVLQQTVSAVLEDATAGAAGFPTDGRDVAVLLRGGGAVFALKDGGVATVMQGMGFGTQTGKWTVEGTTVTVMLDQYEDYGSSHTLGYKLRDLGGAGEKTVPVAFGIVYESKDRTTQQWTKGVGWDAGARTLPDTVKQPLLAADVGDGTAWYGPTAIDPAQARTDGLYAPALLTFRKGADIAGLSWSLEADGTVRLNARSGSGSYRLVRLMPVAAGGELWLQQLMVGGKVVDQGVMSVVKHAPPVMTTASVARLWAFSYDPFADKPSANRMIQWRLKPDGSMTIKGINSSTELSGYKWTLSTDGRTVTVLRPDGRLYRTLQFLAKGADRLFASQGMGTEPDGSIYGMFDLGDSVAPPSADVVAAAAKFAGFWHFSCDGEGRGRVWEIKVEAPARLHFARSVTRSYANADCTGAYIQSTEDTHGEPSDFATVTAIGSMPDGRTRYFFTAGDGAQSQGVLSVDGNSFVIEESPGSRWKSIVRIPGFAFPS